MTHTYQIEGMHCQNCVGKITEVLRRIAGIRSASATLSPPLALIEMDRHVPVSELNASLQSIGSYRLAESFSDAGTDLHSTQPDKVETSLYPLVLILAYLVGTVVIVAWTTHDFTLHSLMTWFMGGFFLVFSFFKLLDLSGFVNAYCSYDIVARRFPAWGYAYPFIELALGIGYFVNWKPAILNMATLLIMLIGSAGVFRALLRKSAIQCACLGTALNLPMTKVTLVEDLGMAIMAAAMLVIVQ